MTTKIWERDLHKILRKVYKVSGVPFPRDNEHSLIDLTEWLLRIPTQRQRIVYKSTQLKNKILTAFEIRCLEVIEKTICRGGNLKPYLGDITRTFRNRLSKKNDFFSSDWGLLHLHLGMDLENNKTRVSRSKRVLIAKFEQDHVYLLDVVNHGRGHPYVWGDISHLEILYKNWPETLDNVRMRGVIPNDDIKTSAADYIKLRNAGMSVPIYIDGKVFLSPNLGIATDGSQTRAVHIAMQIRRELELAESEFRNKEPSSEAFLVVGKDSSIGFLIPKKNIYYSAYKFSTSNKVVNFFQRLLSEVNLSTDKQYREYITPKRLRG